MPCSESCLWAESWDTGGTQLVILPVFKNWYMSMSFAHCLKVFPSFMCSTFIVVYGLVWNMLVMAGSG